MFVKFSFSITTSGNMPPPPASAPAPGQVGAFCFPVRSEWTEFSRNSPAYHVHGDFAQEAAVRRIESLLGDKRAAEWFRNDGHVGILNVWRPINTVEKSPVGFIDISSVDDEKVPIIIIILRKLKT